MVNDEVELSVPASPEFLRMARMTGAGVASRLGFTYEEVEDLRIAIDELLYTLLGRSARPGTITLRYLMSGDAVTIEAWGHFDDELDEMPHLSPLSEQILRSITDECVLDGGPAGPSFRMVKRKRMIGS